MSSMKEKVTFKNVFLFFVIGSMFGAYYEEISFFIRHGYFTTRRSLLYGPFSIVYGISIALAIILFCRKECKTFNLYLKCFLFGGIAEYMLSLIQEIVFHSKSWDYTGYFLNIGGRTTVVFMFFWGLIGTIFVKIIYPYVLKILKKIPYEISQTLYIGLLIFMSIDILLSICANIRQLEREKGKEPYTKFGTFLDKKYPDDVIKEVYNNAKKI